MFRFEGFPRSRGLDRILRRSERKAILSFGSAQDFGFAYTPASAERKHAARIERPEAEASGYLEATAKADSPRE